MSTEKKENCLTIEVNFKITDVPLEIVENWSKNRGVNSDHIKDSEQFQKLKGVVEFLGEVSSRADEYHRENGGTTENNAALNDGANDDF